MQIGDIEELQFPVRQNKETLTVSGKGELCLMGSREPHAAQYLRLGGSREVEQEQDPGAGVVPLREHRPEPLPPIFIKSDVVVHHGSRSCADGLLGLEVDGHQGRAGL
jgi:hypothetical protein